MDFEAAVEVAGVAADGVDGDVELVGDFFSGFALEEEVEDGVEAGGKLLEIFVGVFWPGFFVEPGDFREEDVGDAGFAFVKEGVIEAAEEGEGTDFSGGEGPEGEDEGGDVGLAPEGVDVGLGEVAFFVDLLAEAGEVAFFCDQFLDDGGIEELHVGVFLGGEVVGELLVGEAAFEVDGEGGELAGFGAAEHGPIPGVDLDELAEAVHEEGTFLGKGALSRGDFSEESDESAGVSLGEKGAGRVCHRPSSTKSLSESDRGGDFIFRNLRVRGNGGG